MTATDDRLVTSPVFVISTMRSGSTLLRCLLDTHSRVRAPHELHLASLRVTFDTPYAELAADRLGLDADELAHLLWDRILHRELVRADADVVVEKTPAHAFCWRRLARSWPNARFVFLLRHPQSVLDSLCELSPEVQEGTMATVVAEHVRAVDEARSSLTGPTVRYEELVADPPRVLRALCAALGLPWEPQMLDYGRADHGPLELYLGDFTDKIRSGIVREARPLPAHVHPAVRDGARRWGYLDAAPDATVNRGSAPAAALR